MTLQLVNGRGYGLVYAKDDEEHEGDDAALAAPTLYLYDLIGFDWWTGGGITAKRVIEDLAELGDVSAIDVRINSPGGDVFEGVTIFNALVRTGARVTVHIDGIAASAASLVALAGDEVRIAENAMIMVHRPWTCACGDGEDMRHVATMLDKAWSAMLASYESRTGMRAAEVEQRVVDGGGEWWLTAAEAIDEGFADTRVSSTKAQVFGLSGYRQVPERVAALLDEDSGAVPRREPPAVAEIAAPPRQVAPRGPDPAVEQRRREVECLDLMTR